VQAVERKRYTRLTIIVFIMLNFNVFFLGLSYFSTYLIIMLVLD
jgi:hypothetical protein